MRCRSRNVTGPLSAQELDPDVSQTKAGALGATDLNVTTHSPQKAPRTQSRGAALPDGKKTNGVRPANPTQNQKPRRLNCLLILPISSFQKAFTYKFKPLVCEPMAISKFLVRLHTIGHVDPKPEGSLGVNAHQSND